MAYLIVEIPSDKQEFPGADQAIEHLRGQEGARQLGCEYRAEFGEHLREHNVEHCNYAGLLPSSYHLLETFDDDDIFGAITRIRCFHNDPQGLNPPHGYVARVEPDRQLVLSAPAAEIGTNFKLNATHAKYKGQLNIANAHLSTKGEGRSIAIVDSGIENKTKLSYASYHDLISKHATATPGDDLGHGTAMATIISDIAPKAELHIIRAINRTDTRAWDVMAGIATAVFDCGADIINLSLGFPNLTKGCSVCGVSGQSRSQVFEDLLIALQSVKTRAPVVRLRSPIYVAATGNKTRATVDYPAGYDVALAVGALNSNFERSRFSNYGKAQDRFLMMPGGDTTLNALSAPTEAVGEGQDIHGNTTHCLGTSPATAYASGLLALYWADSRYQSKTPTDFLDDMLALCNTSSINPWYDQNEHGQGRLYFK